MGTANAQITVCSKCGSKNRIDPSRRTAAVCGYCKASLAVDASPVYITDANFQQIVEKSSLPVLIDFWADWCGPCRMVAPVIDQLSRELAGKVVVGKLDVDENHRTAARFQVQGIPMLLIFANAREAARMVGVQSKEAILQKLRPYI
jgi:thioredoxin